MPDTCPACGTTTDNRVGVKIAGVWRYCWLCECGERWGWVNEAEDKRKGMTMAIDLDAMKAELASNRLGMPGFDVNRAIELIAEVERLRAELTTTLVACEQLKAEIAELRQKPYRPPYGTKHK